ncbi:hypothetical protein PhCBS80983_g01135 [Powellomyces hirtus]|uniref:ARID domain-containing protein n=1 Tax=Powellomyces hirtus TaxID=109895 RepID=A0A507EC22_9FUNG|nr:hypothetical protein PhCBS80983_g01135 [Powellomyces hirtus]
MSAPATPAPPSPKPPGRPRTKAEYEDAIERTPEYDAFMKEIDEFNKSFGVTVQREPVLGGKRLDMYRIYQWVIEAGGYDQVTTARGWKKITDPFNLPATCTNSAYVVKQLYQKFLLNYEQHKVHGKSMEELHQQKRPFDQMSNGTADDSTPNSPEVRPKRRLVAAIPAVPTVPTVDTPPIGSLAPEIKPVPLTAATPAPKPAVVPTIAPLVATPAPVPIPVLTPAPATTPAPQPPVVVPIPAISAPVSTPSAPVAARRQFAPSEPLHKRLRLMAEANINAAARSAPSSTPRAQRRARPAMVAVNPDDDGRDEKYLYGAWQNRLMLAMASKLPNEVDWAFAKLIKLSYSKNFYLGILPGVLEEILDHAAPLFDNLELRRQNGIIETRIKSDSHLAPISNVSVFHSPEAENLMERVLQGLHVIRNLSFWPDNALYFVKNYTLLTYMAKGIALAGFSRYIEIKHYCLDLLENLSPYYILQGKDDFFLAVLRQMIMEDDQALIIASTETLTRFCASEVNSRILLEADNAPLVRRLLQLLLVPDERLVTAVLDWFYEFSSLGNSASLLIVEAAGYNVLKLLIKFLAWQGFNKKRPSVHGQTGSTVPAFGTSAGTPAALPMATPQGKRLSTTLPPEFTKVAGQTNGSTSGVSEPVAMDGISYAGQPLLTSDGSIASPMQGIAYLANAALGDDGDLDPAAFPLSSAQGSPSSEQLPLPIECCWRQTNGSEAGTTITSTCPKRFATSDLLFAHVQTEHMPSGAPIDGCRWKACTRGGTGETEKWNRMRLLKHVVTHFGEGDVKLADSASKSARSESQELVTEPTSTIVAPVPNLKGAATAAYAHTRARSVPTTEEELKGIPLTAMLVLRNLARVPDNRALFAAVEGPLVIKMCSEKRFAKGLAGVLAELNRKEA